MRLVVLGLSLSSSWGNGHATTYRALLKAFAARGHDVLFLERDTPWYAAHRDMRDPAFCRFALYADLAELDARWRSEVAQADAVMVGSFTPEGVAVGCWVQANAREVKAFYDIDTPITLAKLVSGDEEYLSADLIPGYDVYFSFTGGPSLALLESRYGSPAARALYCSVDPDVYQPLRVPLRWDLSYLGTYSQDRQRTLERLLIETADAAPDLRFCVAGPQYPDDIAWPGNVERIDHVAPAEHPAFYSASRFTLNLTREAMITAGYSPSVRLFEAAACGAPIISDTWRGLDELFAPGSEILIASNTSDVLSALRGITDQTPAQIGLAARLRVLAGHTAERRALELEAELQSALGRKRDASRPARPTRNAEPKPLSPERTLEPVMPENATLSNALPAMQAAVVTGPGAMEIRRVERPEPGADEVRVRLEGCGVCASNLTPWAGPDWMRFPTAPGELGHEGWGVIDAIGAEIDELAVGDRVACLSHRSYAEFDIARAEAVVRLPAALNGQPFPGEPLGCAMNIFRRAEITIGQTVAIVGIGFLGAILTRLATDAGARVVAISRRRYSLDVARRMGAAETIPMDDHYRIIAEVRDLTGGHFCERVIEAVGKQWPLDLAGELTAERGRLIIAGYHQDGPRQVNMQLWNWRGLDVINAHERDPAAYARGVREAVEAVASGRLDPTPLYTHTYPLARLAQALDATRDRPEGFMKALLHL